MITVRKKQIEKMDEKYYQNFIQMAVEYIQENYPEYYFQNELSKWQIWVKTKISESEYYKIEKNSEIMEYIDLHLNYDILNKEPKDRWVIDLLTYPDRMAEKKIDMLIEQLNFR